MIKAALRDSVIYGLAALLSRGLAIFLLPLYTRLLSPGDYGGYDLLVTIGVLANLVVALEVSQGLARQLADAPDPAERRRLISTTLWFTLLMYGLFLLLGLSAAEPLTVWLLGDARQQIAYMLGLAFIAANGVYNLLLNQFRWELRSRAYALASLVSAVLTLLLTAVFGLLLKLGLPGILLAQLLAQGLAVLLCLWLLRERFGLTFFLPGLRAMLHFSMPLVPAGLAVFISLYINRFALREYATLADIGLFGIASRIAGLAVLLIMGIQAALTPLVYQHYREPETPGHIARLFGGFLALALPLCLFLALFAQELLWLLATPAFGPAAPLVALLAPAMLLSQMYIFAPGIAIHKRTVWQLWVTLASALVSLLGNWLLVPLYGIFGAALATLLAALVFFSAWMALSQRLYPIPFAWRGIAVAVSGFCGAVLLGATLARSGLGMVTLAGLKLLCLLGMLWLVRQSGLVSRADGAAFAQKLRQRLRRGKV